MKCSRPRRRICARNRRNGGCVTAGRARSLKGHECAIAERAWTSARDGRDQHHALHRRAARPAHHFHDSRLTRDTARFRTSTGELRLRRCALPSVFSANSPGAMSTQHPAIRSCIGLASILATSSSGAARLRATASTSRHGSSRSRSRVRSACRVRCVSRLTVSSMRRSSTLATST